MDCLKTIIMCDITNFIYNESTLVYQPEVDRLPRNKEQASKFKDLRSNLGVTRTRHPQF